MTTALFTRRTEDFDCAVCHTHVTGNGYTNHCPTCLYSKHVDINPGDRASPCHGLMRPIGLDTKSGQQYIIHQCEKCGFTRRNKVSPDDDFRAVMALSNGTMDAYCARLIQTQK